MADSITESQSQLRDRVSERKESYQDMQGANIIIDTRGDIVYASEEFYNLFDIEQEKRGGLKLSDILARDNLENREIIKHSFDVARGKRTDLPVVSFQSDEQIKSFRVIPKFIRSESNEKIGLSLNVQDVSQEMIDPLTNVPNRRFFNEELLKSLKKTLRLIDKEEEYDNLWIIMGDINSFKAYNDIFGHLEGDNVLRTVAYATRVRLPDLQARYGGEEFAFIVPGDRELVQTIIDRFNSEIDKLPSRISPVEYNDDARDIHIAQGQEIKVSMSFGATSVTSVIRESRLEHINLEDTEDAMTYHLITRADNNFHLAKKDPAKKAVIDLV